MFFMTKVIIGPSASSAKQNFLERTPRLFVAQGHDGIHTRRALRRDHACRESHNN